MLAERRFPALGADSSRHTQTKLPMLQKDQLTAGTMQHQLLLGTGTNSCGQQDQCLRITEPGRQPVESDPQAWPEQARAGDKLQQEPPTTSPEALNSIKNAPLT